MDGLTDTATLDVLRGEVGDEVVRELVTLFADESAARLEAMVRCLAEDDAPGLHAAAHSMKGSALNLGAARLASLCATLEKCEAPEARRALVADVEAELARVRAAFLAAVHAG